MSSLNDQGKQTAAPRVQRDEDGRDITNFFSIYEVDCIRSKVPPDLWGEHVGDHLVGEALAYYLHMRRMGVDLRQWDTVRERFLRRFCRATRETVLAQLYRNTWRGDHGLYISCFFLQAVSRAVTFTPEELVELFLSKLPPDIKRQLTHSHTSVLYATTIGKKQQ